MLKHLDNQGISLQLVREVVMIIILDQPNVWPRLQKPNQAQINLLKEFNPNLRKIKLLRRPTRPINQKVVQPPSKERFRGFKFLVYIILNIKTT